MIMEMKQENLDHNSENNESSTSSTVVSSAPLTRRRQELTFFQEKFIKNNDTKKQYYFKPKPLVRAQWEAYGAAIHQFIVTKQYVPNYKAYEGNLDPMEQWGDALVSIINCGLNDRLDLLKKLINGELLLKFSIQPTAPMHGVASKAIDFVSSADDPLKEEDVVMACQPFFNEFMSARIKKMLSEPTKKLEDDFEKRSLTLKVVNFFSPPNTPLEFYKEVLASLDWATPQMMRKWHENPLCPEELKFLLFRWMSQDIEEAHLKLSIPIFEQFDTQYPLFERDQTLKCSYKGKEYSISSNLLYQYRLLKGQGRTGIIRWIYQDWDPNKSNGSKKGQMIDFEYSKMNVLMRGVFWEPYIKLIGKIQQELGLTTEESSNKEEFGYDFYIKAFKFLGFEHEPLSPELIARFPDFGDKEQYAHYHCTQRNYFSRALFGFITSLLVEFRNSDITDSIFSKFITTLLPSLFDSTELESNFIDKFTDVCHLGYFTVKGFLSGNPEVDLWKKRVILTRLLDKWDHYYKNNQGLFEYIEEFLLEKLGSKNKVFSKQENESKSTSFLSSYIYIS